MGVGSGDRGDLGPPWILKLLAKKVVFSISRGKNQISPLLDRPWKTFLENPLLPPGKNPSGTHEPSAPKLKMAKKRNKSHIIFATLLMCLQSLEKNATLGRQTAPDISSVSTRTFPMLQNPIAGNLMLSFC